MRGRCVFSRFPGSSCGYTYHKYKNSSIANLSETYVEMNVVNQVTCLNYVLKWRWNSRLCGRKEPDRGNNSPYAAMNY